MNQIDIQAQIKRLKAIRRAHEECLYKMGATYTPQDHNRFKETIEAINKALIKMEEHGRKAKTKNS